MTRRFGTIGHWSASPGFGLGLADALIASIDRANRTPQPPSTPTPEQIAAADKRSERQRWNDEVQVRKAAKKARSP